jgi:hypothetical protein
MINKLYDTLLHNLSRHTNLSQPYSDYVKSDSFPKQNSELLNKEVTIKYRDYKIVEEDKNNIKIHRPKDDTDLITGHHNTGPEDYDANDVYTGTFKVLRADKSEPYVLIGVSKDYSKIVVNSTKPMENGKLEYTEKISIYPRQINELIGLELSDQFVGEIDEIRATSLRVDNGEPCYSVLMEILGSTGYVRFILGDEVQSIVRDYYDDKGENDYNGMDSVENHGTPVDVDGYKADHSKISSYKDIDGGPANTFCKLYTDIMNDEEVATFRKKTIEGKKIYGSN